MSLEVNSSFLLLTAMRRVFHCLFHKDGSKQVRISLTWTWALDLWVFLFFIIICFELHLIQCWQQPGFPPDSSERRSCSLTLWFLSVNSQKVTKTFLHVPSHIYSTVFFFSFFSCSLFFFASSDLLHTNFVFVQDCWSLILTWFHTGNMEGLHKVYDPAEAYLCRPVSDKFNVGAQLLLAVCQRCVCSAIAQLW